LLFSERFLKANIPQLFRDPWKLYNKIFGMIFTVFNRNKEYMRQDKIMQVEIE